MTGATTAMMVVRDPDVRLMIRVREADDRAAFAELVERYQRRLVGVMHHLVGHADEAEDLAQEVFLRVYRTRQKYSPQAKFSTWLFTIANNLALNNLRDRKRKPTVPLAVSDSGVRPQEQLANPRTEAPGHALAHAELAIVIRQALDDLNDRQKMAIVLNKFEDMGYAEIADVMGMTEKAVKSLLSRARGRLREALAPYVDMDGVRTTLQDDGADDEP
jgi:RNA polymerase sigma-70 factor (ECF subfamily)